MTDATLWTRRAVVLAGGQGLRLRPYTTVLPKPLMPVGDRPILEHVLRQLGQSGFRRITISVGHLAELIQAVCGDGTRWDLTLDYAVEDEPLGTIGPLSFIDELGEDFLVMNGDVLTDLNPAKLWDFHQSAGAALTVATHRREVHVDYGVLHYDAAHNIERFEEKPTLAYDVSMGVYILNRRCLEYVPQGQAFGFDQLMLALLAAGERVKAFPHAGHWLDLGRPEDYEHANREIPGSFRDR